MSSDAVELLAPARDEGCGRAAIDAGADAVYIGPERFGAREKAGNSLASIEALCRYAHRYRARVYATVNTLLHDRELPLAETLIRQLWDLGIDAVIVQDLGLLELGLPPVPLFASTQLDCTDGAKARFLEELGFARVILARELSLLELQEIRAATTVPLEVFVHGALCVSYSGRCSASFALGGRSANRGACAQPCRWTSASAPSRSRGASRMSATRATWWGTTAAPWTRCSRREVGPRPRAVAWSWASSQTPAAPSAAAPPPTSCTGARRR